VFESIVEGVEGDLGLFLICCVTGLLIPVPEDLVVLYAGWLIAEGTRDWTSTVLIVSLGMLIRDLLTYALGRTAGNWLLERPWTERVIGRRKLARAREMFAERGTTAVVIGRFLVGMRVPVFFIGGSMRLPFRKFLVLDAIGVMLSVPLLLLLGNVFGQPLIDGARQVLKHTSWSIAVITAITVWVVYRLSTRNRIEPTAEQAEVGP